MAAQTDTKPKKPRGAARRGSRPARWARRISVLLLVLVGVGVTLVLARNAIIRAAIKPRLEAMLGVELVSGRIYAAMDGAVTMHDVQFRAPGVPGDAGVVLSAERITAMVDLPGLVSGGGAAAILDVEATAPVFRLSQAVLDGSLNIDSIVRHTGVAARPATLRLPQIRFTDGRIEFGEHQAEWYNPLAQLRVEGVLEAPDADSPDYRLTLIEMVEGLRPRMQLTGRIDANDASARLDMTDLDLAAWSPASSPTNVRAILSRMALAGRAPRATFIYDPQTGVEAEFQLARVGVTLPAPLGAGAPGRTPSPELLRMREVDGVIRFDRQGLRADLSGLVEEVPARVRLETSGFELASPFDAVVDVDPFFFREGVGAALFAPPDAQEIIRMFLGPQAIVGGSVHLVRETSGGEVLVDGELDFTDGQMAYVRFPYPVRDISGRVRFDEEGLALLNLRGFGPTGALVHCSGEIVGYDERAGVDLRIRAERTPVDDVLKDAMPESWRPLIDELMSREAFDALRESGFLQSEADRAALAAAIAQRSYEMDEDPTLRTSERRAIEREIAAMRDRLRAPVFEPGGVGAADVHITRAFGPESEYSFRIGARVDNAALLPRAMPHPLLSEVLLVDVNDTRVLITAAPLRGLTGGVGLGRIEVDLQDEGAVPRVDVSMEGVPIDALLLSAIPDIPMGGDAADTPTLNALVRGLGFRGGVDPTINVLPGDDGEAVYEVNIAFQDVTAAPAGAEREILTAIGGRVRAGSGGFELSGVEGLLDGAPLRLDARYADGAGAQARLEIDGMFLHSPVETVARVLSRDIGDELASLRGRWDPAGRVDVRAEFASLTEAEPRIAVRLSDARSVSFNLFGGRVAATRSRGDIRIEPNASRVVFEGFETPLLFNNEPSGELALDGWASYDDDSGMDLRAMLRAGRLESELVRRGVRDRFGDAAADAIEHRRLVGGFAAGAALRAAPGEPVAYETWIEPHSLAFGEAGERVEAARVEGRINILPTGGSAEALRLQSEQWSAQIDAAWTTDPTVQLGADVSIDSLGWPRELMALLPKAASGPLDAVSFRIDGPWGVRAARLEIEADGETLEVASGSLAARLQFHDASFDAGVEVDRAIGIAGLDVRWRRDESAQLRLDSYIETLRCAKIQMTDARVSLVSEAGTSRLSVEDFSADFCDGRIAGHVVIDDADAAGAQRYAADLRLAGVDFGLLVESLADPDAVLRGPGGERGMVSGMIAVSGTLGEPLSRLSRGMLLVEAGEIVRLPLLLPVLELTSLQPPVGERLTFGMVEFASEGGVMSIERILVQSETLVVAGQGSLMLATGEVDLVFTSRGRRRVPLLSALLDALRNELLGARVTGTLADPRFRAQALPGAGRVLHGLLGSSHRETGIVGVPTLREGRESDTPVIRLEH